MSLFAELKRRNVFRVAIAYIIVAWLLMQIGDTLAPALRLPEWTTSLLAFFLILGFPLAVFFAWAFELTPEGIRPEKSVPREESVSGTTGRRLNYLIIGLLTIAVAYIAYDRFVAGPPGMDETATAVDMSSGRKSIAVLPFVNMSSDPEQEFFSDGLSEELLNLLAKIPQLRVTSRSSAFYYKGKDIKLTDVGRELGVEHVLEGSVRRSGNQVRITAQLIGVQDDAHIWSNAWDRDLINVFEIQDEIAAAVATALKIQLVDELPHAYVTDPEAYALYLKTSPMMTDYSEESLDEAEELLQQVLAIDPDYVPALVRLSSVYATLSGWGFMQRDEAAAKSQFYAQKSIDIDPDFAEGYIALAREAYEERHEVAAAERYVEKARSLEPDNFKVKIWIGIFAALRGNPNPALEAAQEMVRRDPHSALAHRYLGHVYMYVRRFEDAVIELRQVQEINPDSIVNHAALGQALFLSGRYEEALAEFEQEPIEEFKWYGRAISHHRLGNSEKSQEAIDRLIEMDNENFAAQIAQAQSIRGEIDSAIMWLNLGFQRYDIGVNIAAVDPFHENLHGDPRYEDFLIRLQSPPE